jgi:hypothetical protein
MGKLLVRCVLLWMVYGAVGCAGSAPPPAPTAASPVAASVAVAPAAVPTPAELPAASRPPAPPAELPVTPPSEAPAIGRDFTSEASGFYRAVACGPSGEVPAGLDRVVIDKHCLEMAARYRRFTEKYVVPAQTFFAALRPADAPTKVVYPFGGGDLGSALVTFPQATEITTISLEHAGDPTRLGKLTPAALRRSLADFRAAVHGLLTNNDSTSENMRKLERGGIPGQLSFHLTGAAALGYEPVSLKFFTFEDSGQIHYLSQQEIDALAPVRAKRKKSSWVDTDFSTAFTNMELTLRKTADPSAPLVIHRHVAANLANAGFSGSALEKHVLAKGPVAAMTKAASYLLWSDSFSAIRDYLTANLVWMASDATGIPTRNAKRAGLAQTTYGRFAGAFLPSAPVSVGATMVKLWEEQPRRKLAFRYGYPDSQGNVHLMITARTAR